MKSLVSWCFSLLRSLSTRKTSFPRSRYSSNILSGLSDLLYPSKLGKAPQSAQRLLSELLSGDGEIRTLDPLLARQVLSQLSYTPTDAVPSSVVSLVSFLFDGLSRWLPPMGLSGLEPPTSRLSGVRSNRLSYKPPQIWQPPALPHRLQCSTIGRLGLNHRVRDENGCLP